MNLKIKNTQYYTIIKLLKINIMKVKTLELMMLNAQLPVNDHLELFFSGVNFDREAKFTHLNLMNDLIPDSYTIMDVIGSGNSDLIMGLYTFSEIVNHGREQYSLYYSKAHELAFQIAQACNLPELSEINGQYSLRTAIVLITGIKDLPGYAYQTVVDFYHQSNSHLPTEELATNFMNSYTYPLKDMAFEFKNWWDTVKNSFCESKQEFLNNPVQVFKAQMAINTKLEELQKKFNIPYYLKG